MQLDDLAALGGEPTRGRDLRSRGRETIGRLVRAGRHVIDERGHDQTRVDDIVTTAGLSHGTFYLYFKDREDLLASLVRATCRTLAPLGDILVGEPTVETLSTWLREVVHVCDESAEVLRAARSLGTDEIAEVLTEQVGAWLASSDSHHPHLCADLLVGHLERAIVRDDIIDHDELAKATLRCSGLV